ncbi:MAG: hypothetical protein IKW90_08855 [Lachnospiraceae bacterium]|nr:hypothetical protein [Lachnospiraceae bacterium]
MRIYIDEMHRLWRTPGIIFAVIIACFATFGVLKLRSKGMLYYVQPEEYKEAFQKMDGMQLGEAYALYADKEYDMMDFSREAFLNKAVRDELEEQLTYEDYLAGITDEAERLTSVSIFADKDSFLYRNAIKTSGVYEKLKGKIGIEPGPSKGLELWSGNGVTGLIIILVLLVMINEIVLKDRESGQLNLLFTMDKGRGTHGFIKLLVCCTSAFAVTFIVLLTAFFTSGYIIGNGDVTRSVQSVTGLKGCTMETSVLGYMLVYFLVLSVTAAVLSIIIFLTASVLKSSVAVYLTVAAIFGTEAVLYYLIGENSYLAFLKEFNLMSFMDTGRYLSVYGNVSIFGYPVNRFVFVMVSLILLISVFLPLAIKAYSVQTTVTVRKSRKSKGWLKCPVPKSVSPFLHEAYKLLICGGTLWVLLLFAGYQAAGYTPVREYFENEDSLYYKKYALMFEGPVTEETVKAINAEKNRFKEIEEEMRKVLAECPPELASSISMQYQEQLKPKMGFEMFVSRVEQLKHSGAYIVYDTGYRLLTFDKLAKSKEITLGITAGIMLVLTLSYLFAGDDRLYIERVTSVTLNGRRALFLKKVILGSLVVLVIYCLNYLPYILSTLTVYGSGGLGFPTQSVRNLEGTVFEKLGFSIGGSIAFYAVLKYMFMIAEMLVLSLISKKLRSLSRTIVTGLVVFVGPLLIMYVMN